jgi:hypothetical protein
VSGWESVGQTLRTAGEVMAAKLVEAFKDALAEALSSGVARSQVRCLSDRCDELMGKVWDLLEKASSGARTLGYLQENHVTVVPIWGMGSAYSPRDGRIYLDLSQGAEEAALALVHEATHHEYDNQGLRPEAREVGQDQWVGAMLGEETEATSRAVEAGNDLAESGAGMGGVDYPGREAYNQAADTARQAAEAADPGGDPADWDEAGREAGRQGVRGLFDDGTMQATDSQTGQSMSYPDYLASDWQGQQR